MLRIFIRLRVFWWNFFNRNGVFLFYCRSVTFWVLLFSDFSVISKSRFEMTKNVLFFRISLSCLSYFRSVFRYHAFCMLEFSVLSFISPLLLKREEFIFFKALKYVSPFIYIKNDINFLQIIFQDFQNELNTFFCLVDRRFQDNKSHEII